MNKVALIAAREFVATITSRGFLVGLLIMPAILVIAVFVAPRILNARSPQIRGDVAVIDPTGHVMGGLRTALDPATIEAQRLENMRRRLEAAAPGMGGVAASNQSIQIAAGQIPALRLVERPADAELQREKDWLVTQNADERHLALLVLNTDAVVRAEGKSDYGSYDLYVSTSLDDATETVINEGVRQALVGARLKANNVNQAAVESMLRVARPSSVIVGARGEQRAQRGFNRALPFVLGLLMFMGVMLGGQTLMTSTIEEKSSRVIEVLLAAVSPMELMAGKLLGQLGVGLFAMIVYAGLGVMALFQFAMLGLLDPMLVVYLLAFFLITYLVYGAVMMAIGAAVNQTADAQSLLGPVMLSLIAPYVLAPMIARAPNSTFAVAVSFIPPVNTFAMMARLASGTPPPAWQALLTMAIGVATACAAVWFAAKIFKIGLLMHGKPPNYATLIRWMRAA